METLLILGTFTGVCLAFGAVVYLRWIRREERK